MSKLLRSLPKKQLSGAGYKIAASVGTGELAIEKVKCLKPDVVLMILNLSVL